MSALRLESTSDGLLLPIRVQAGARRNHVGGVHDGRLRVTVTQAPERGKANREVLKLLAAAFNVRRSDLWLHSGETSPRKKVCVAGLSADELRERVNALT